VRELFDSSIAPGRFYRAAGALTPTSINIATSLRSRSSVAVIAIFPEAVRRGG